MITDFSLTRMDAYIQKELKEKNAKIIAFSICLMLPGFAVKAFAIFMLVAFLLPADIKGKKSDALYFLPFSRKELFIYTLLFALTLVTAINIIYLSVININYIDKLLYLVKIINFTLAIFGIVMLSVSFNLDNIGMPILFLIIDIIIGGLGTTSYLNSNFNPYRLISPIYQKNILLSFIFALALCSLAFYVFLKKGGEIE